MITQRKVTTKKTAYTLATTATLLILASLLQAKEARAWSHCPTSPTNYCETGDWWYKDGTGGCDTDGNYTGWKALCHYVEDGRYCAEYQADYVTGETAGFCTGGGDDDNGGASGGNITEHLGGWPFSDIGRLVSSGVQAATILAGLLLFAFLLYGGLQYLVSGGDEKGIVKAKAILTNATIGLVLVVAAFGITRIVEIVFGVRILGGITLPRP